jgi:hypothetical protein
MANGTPVANPGWEDIQGIFAPFTSQMMWRLNLGDYENVKANAQIILLRLTQPGLTMPPPGFPPLTQAQVTTFQNWVDQGCPQTAGSGSSASATTAAPPAVAAAAPNSAPSTDGFRFR